MKRQTHGVAKLQVALDPPTPARGRARVRNPSLGRGAYFFLQTKHTPGGEIKDLGGIVFFSREHNPPGGETDKSCFAAEKVMGWGKTLGGGGD